MIETSTFQDKTVGLFQEKKLEKANGFVYFNLGRNYAVVKSATTPVSQTLGIILENTSRNHRMEKIEIYSSKKKALVVVLGSLLFVVVGIYMFINAEDFTSYRSRFPLYTKMLGIVSALFFGTALLISIKQLFTDKLILVIDKFGVNVNPKKSLEEYIEWKNIIGFSELKIHRQKFVVIDINNSDYWIQKEKNRLRKKLMKFNFRNYGSPFNLSANVMQTNYAELVKILNENLNKYKYNA